MDLVIPALLFIGSILVAIACNMVASELYGRCSWLAQRLVEYAVAQLPSEQRARYREEWSAYLAECEGNISKISQAIGLVIGGKRIARFQISSQQRIKASLKEEFLALVKEFKQIEESAAYSELVEFEVEFSTEEISVLDELADRYGCSAGVISSALVKFGLNHWNEFKLERNLRDGDQLTRN